MKYSLSAFLLILSMASVTLDKDYNKEKGNHIKLFVSWGMGGKGEEEGEEEGEVRRGRPSYTDLLFI